VASAHALAGPLIPIVTAWVRQTWEAINPFPTGAYVNFMSDEPQDLYGPEKYARLVALKRRYDPENVFRHNQNITP
jgi:hypothetical protein